MKKKICCFILSVLVVFGLVPLIVNILFQHSIPIKIFHAQWNADDALGYVGGALSFMGTMFLGWVSWKQNQVLQKRQDDTLIAEHSCMVLLEKMEFKNVDRKATSLDIHPETIAVADGSMNSFWNYSSFECDITLKHLKNYPIVVRTLAVQLQVLNTVVEFKQYDNFFTRIAVSKDGSRFKLTLILSATEKQRLITLIKGGKNEIYLDIMMELVSDRYVSTKQKCRSVLKMAEDTGLLEYVSDDAEMSFWYESKLLDPSEIQYRCTKRENH